MEIANCEIRLGGDVLNSTIKQEVTPSELMLLKGIHGEDSIVNIEITGTVKRPYREEFERLKSIYRDAKNTNNEEVFKSIFPNDFVSALPVEFSDIGVDIEVNLDDESGGKRRGRPPKEKKSAVVPFASKQIAPGIPDLPVPPVGPVDNLNDSDPGGTPEEPVKEE